MGTRKGMWQWGLASVLGGAAGVALACAAFVNDDFNDGTIDPVWQVLNGDPPELQSLAESGGTLNVAAGPNTNMFDGQDNAPFIHQTGVCDADCEITLKAVGLAPDRKFEGASLAARWGAADWIKVNHAYTGGGKKQVYTVRQDAGAHDALSFSTTSASTVWFRLRRTNRNSWMSSYSVNGTTWTVLDQFAKDEGAAVSVGMVVEDGDSGQGYSASFDEMALAVPREHLTWNASYNAAQTTFADPANGTVFGPFSTAVMKDDKKYRAGTFTSGGHTETIRKVEAMIQFKTSGTCSKTTFGLSVYMNGVKQGATVYAPVSAAAKSNCNGYINAVGRYRLDVTGARAWSWADFDSAGLELEVVTKKGSGDNSSVTFSLDRSAFVVSY
jgi:hypothetical protein